MAGDIAGVTNLSGLTLSSTLSVGGQASFTAGVTAPSYVTLSGGASMAGAQLSLATWGFSITTASQMSEVAPNTLALVFQASGISLCFRSGSTIYTVGASATSAARV